MKTSVAYVSSPSRWPDEINVEVDLSGELDLKFKSENFPLERFADSGVIGQIQGGTANPAANPATQPTPPARGECTAQGGPTMTTQAPMVVLDPGHGGHAEAGGSSPNNTRGYGGLLERDLTLDLARRVVDAMSSHVMRRRRGWRRAADTDLSLADRAAVARNTNAQVFVSIHFNGDQDPAVDGTEAWVATHASAGAANGSRNRLFERRRDGGESAQPRRQGCATLGVLVAVAPRRAGTAACLLEVAFLSNRAEADKLRAVEGICLDDIALAVAQGIGDTLAGADAGAPAIRLEARSPAPCTPHA